eukprot:975437-Amphidinium_carterae.1
MQDCPHGSNAARLGRKRSSSWCQNGHIKTNDGAGQRATIGVSLSEELACPSRSKEILGRMGCPQE